MRTLRLNAIAALMAAALAACGGGGGGGGDPGAPSPAPAPAPVPAPPPPPPPASQSAPENTLSSSSANVTTSSTLSFGSGSGNLITIDDPDSDSLTTFLQVTAGSLRMEGGSGATITGDGTANVAVTGSVAQINLALNGMVYTAPDTAQDVILQIVTQDDSTPTALSDTDQFTLTVTVAEFQSFQAASIVLGQANFLSGGSGPPNDHNLLAPRGAVAVRGFGTIYVPDAGHNRVLVFPNGSDTGDSATLVLGQSGSFTTGGSSVEQGKHPQAAHVAIAAGRMAVAEPSANRVSLYHTVPISSSTMPGGLLGQDLFTDSVAACFAARLNGPESVAITPDGSKMIVADTGNNRVTIYPTPAPGEISPVADVVLGQASGSNCFPNRNLGSPDSGTLNQPRGVWTDGNRLVVADTANNRVLIWTTIPDGDAGDSERRAHRVLGQENFASMLANRGTTPGDATLNGPTHVASDGTRLAVADTGNNRVLIWTTFPTTDGAPANVVIGQRGFSGTLPNDGTGSPSAEALSSPTGLHFFNGKLYVTDRGNNRILVFQPQ